MSSDAAMGLSLKLQRTVTAFLPIDDNRRGACLRCGRCCRFVFRCPFYDEKGCAIYSVRPLQCRKYPRTRLESIVRNCGFTFGG